MDSVCSSVGGKHHFVHQRLRFPSHIRMVLVELRDGWKLFQPRGNDSVLLDGAPLLLDLLDLAFKMPHCSN